MVQNRFKKICVYTVFLANLYPAMAQTHQIYPSKDNTIYDEGDLSNAKGIYLFSGTTNTAGERRTLLQFDLSGIGSEDSIINVSLQLTMNKTITGEHLFSLHKLNSDWGEGTSDAPFEEGGGADATTGDATWNYNFYNDHAWSGPGGDYNLIPSAVKLIHDVGIYSWTGDTMINDVNSWLSDPGSNFGWILLTNDTISSSKRFNSRESPQDKPVLNVTYTPKVSVQNRLELFRNINVYPNPGNGKITLSGIDQSAINIVRVYTVTGSLIKPEITRISSSEIQLHIPFAGTYFISIDNMIYKKIVVL